jgi:hypothetical protein
VPILAGKFVFTNTGKKVFHVVPVKPKLLNVVSTDIHIFYCVMFSFVYYFENKQGVLILYQLQQYNFDIMNVVVLNKEK